MDAPRIKKLLKSAEPGEKVTIEGWIRSCRDQGDLSFLDVNDGSSLQSLQAVAKADLENYENEIKGVSTGSSVIIDGEIIESPAKGQRIELAATKVTVIDDAGSDYPLSKKRHTFERLRELAHLRPRTNAIGATMRVRHELAMSIHDFFRERGFYWAHTPIITSSDAEGAGEMFRVTTQNLNKPKRDKEGVVDAKKDFFARDTFLTVSGQLEGEAMALAMSRIYTFGPAFRAENSNTSRHASEFWMVEPEVAFCDTRGNQDLAEDFLKHTITHALNKCEDDLAFFDQRVEKGLLESLRHVVETPFERMGYTEAISLLKKSGKKFEVTPVWGKALQSEHERYLCEDVLKKPIILTDYPAENAAFYMRLNDDEKTVANMDVLVPRIGEIIGGAQREEREDVLLEKMKAHGIDEEAYWWFVDLRRYGTVPHAGFGLGFERLIMYVTGMKNIRDVIPFPRTPRFAEF
ncbi:MAG: asparagine--tRNA ligase [Deltaproteobacteria bacterium]|nr:asparagine--tRNA ligase [Deltaproteobacteria bacterium]